MSTAQHFADLKNLKGFHVKKDNTTEGGSCLNRHQTRAENSCSHQWQAMKRAEEDKKLYNWPKYQDMGASTQVFYRSAPKKVPKPAQGDWDVGAGENFKHCNKPYYNEAHHIVPNSTLAKAIAKAFGGKQYVLRGALLKAGYNLNYKYNMIILPLDEEVAKTIQLPRHRKLPLMHHNDYSSAVGKSLVGLFQKAAQAIASHGDPDKIGATCKEHINMYALQLYYQIIEAGKDEETMALDDIHEEWLEPPEDFGEDDLLADDKSDT